MEMADFFNSKYQELKEKTSDACNCIKAKPCSSLSSELNDVLSRIKSLNKSLISGDLASSYSQSIDSISSDLILVIGCIDGLFSTSENLYLSLDQHLDALKDYSKKYDSVQSERYQTKNKGAFVFNTKDKDNFERDKNARLNRIERSCKEEQTIIDNIVESLKSIDGMSLDGDSISLINSFNSYFLDDEVYSFTNVELLNSLYARLKSKVDIEKMGFTKEEVLKELLDLINKKNRKVSNVNGEEVTPGFSFRLSYLSNAEMALNDILATCPNNFNELMSSKESYLNSGNMSEDFSINGNVQNVSFNYGSINKSIVNVGGQNFEIYETFDNENPSFFDVLESKISKSLIINNLASYPEEFFNSISGKEKGGQTSIILINSKTELKLKDKRCAGIFAAEEDKGGTVFLRAKGLNGESNYGYGGNIIKVMNHEFGHMYDNIEGKNISFEQKGEVFKNDYSKVANHSYGEYNKTSKSYSSKSLVGEMFAESTDYFLRYGPEAQEEAPMIYDFYQNMFHIDFDNRTTNPIIIGEEEVNLDMDFIENYMWGHN